MPVTHKVESCPVQGKAEYTGEEGSTSLYPREHEPHFRARMPMMELDSEGATTEGNHEYSKFEGQKLYKIRIKHTHDRSVIERNNFGPLRWSGNDSDLGYDPSFHQESEEKELEDCGDWTIRSGVDDVISSEQDERTTMTQNQTPQSKVSLSSRLDYFDVGCMQPKNQVPRFSNQYLRPNARFKGQQISEKGTFDVHVELKTVDLVNSLVTGFLQIWGLTVGCRVITTFFKGEIINNPLNKFDWKDNATPADVQVKRYSFLTENKHWGSCEKNDLEHWEILTRRDTLDLKLREKLQNIQTKDHKNQFVYMRWKEEFLVPDSRIKQISGASFEGFYYIVLNIGDGRSRKDDSSNALSLPGSISGLYYHQVSDKLQALTLGYIDDEKGSNSGFDFC